MAPPALGGLGGRKGGVDFVWGSVGGESDDLREIGRIPQLAFMDVIWSGVLAADDGHSMPPVVILSCDGGNQKIAHFGIREIKTLGVLPPGTIQITRQRDARMWAGTGGLDRGDRVDHHL